MGSLFARAGLSPKNRLVGLVATAMTADLGLNAYGMVLFYDPIM
jgi:hypothetical protein